MTGDPLILGPLAIVLVGGAATFVWRGLGVALASRIDPDGAVFEWVGCVSFALLAGLLARLLVLPLGELATIPLWVRIGAAGLSIAVFWLAGRHVLLGVLVGTGCFTALVALG